MLFNHFKWISPLLRHFNTAYEQLRLETTSVKYFRRTLTTFLVSNEGRLDRRLLKLDPDDQRKLIKFSLASRSLEPSELRGFRAQ